jgi:hypothetical protein
MTRVSSRVTHVIASSSAFRRCGERYSAVMRALLFCLVLVGAGYGAWQLRGRVLSLLKPAAPSTAEKAREIDACRDQCEQRQIVERSGGDEELRACRARCAGQSSAAARPHEVPSRITVAPAVSRPRVYSKPAEQPLRGTDPLR